jgi:hypothetical protein
MQLQAHFHDIQGAITRHLKAAQDEILAAVAWFTDREIFDVLCQQAQAGVQVSIAVLADDINQAPGALNFRRLCNLGGRVAFLPSGSDGEPMMHHKFCVLDGHTVITGSYNWSKKARRNDENITVATEAPEFAAKCREAFHDLLGRIGQAGESATPDADADAARRRLEMVRNLILLGEQEDLPRHLVKLRAVAQALQFQPIMQALERGAYKEALESIEDYLRRRSAIVVREDTDVPRLQLELQALELRLLSLSEEKDDLERRLVIFNRRYSDALGPLLTEVLKARADLAKQEAEVSRRRATEGQASMQDAEHDAQRAEQARRDWQDYEDEYTEQQAAAPPGKLSAEEEAELKRLYRRACGLCHPDKFSEEQKSAAHRAFVRLQEIYNANDLQALGELYEELKAGGLSIAPRSSTLSRADALRAAIAELRHRITETLHQLRALHNSEGAALLRKAGDGESDWTLFFERQAHLLQAELERLRQALTTARQCEPACNAGTSDGEY